MTYTDDDLRQLRDICFGAPDKPDDEPGDVEQQHLVVPAEGTNPDPGPTSPEQRNRAWAHALFTGDDALVEPDPPGPFVPNVLDTY